MAKSCPHCGCELDKPRSGPDHRRFFALIHAAFHHWPETHEEKFANAEALRAWLLCKAGHCTVVKIPVPSAEPAILDLARLAAEAAIAAAETHAFIRPGRAGLAVFTPRSIAYGEIDQRAFGQIRQMVEDIISDVIGVSADELLRQHERAA